ncbi:MAG: hypothetical protein R2711_08005 [Acidimicrobiales bacterium]
MTTAERLPVAVDAMGGDGAPAEIVAGAVRARDELGVPVVLVGRPEDLPDTGGLEVIPASEVIAMGRGSGRASVMKDSSLISAAEAFVLRPGGPAPWCRRATRAPRWRPRCSA